jgi:cytochrome c-type biogenesis protein
MVPSMLRPTGHHHRPSRAQISAMATVLFLLFILLLSTNTASAAPGLDESSDPMMGPTMDLFLAGDSALSPGNPNGDADSEATFRPGVGVNSVEVGIWRSRPVQGELEVHGKIGVSIWAQGSGLQSSCYFGIYIGVDGEAISETIHTQESALTTSPKEFTGEGMADFNLTEGQTITATIRVHERGTGGAILFGSSAHSSHISLHAEAVRTATYAEEHSAGQSILVTTLIEDVWGVEDIEGVDQYIIGPFKDRQLDIDVDTIPEDKVVARASSDDQMSTDVSSATMNVSWRWSYSDWEYDGKEVEPGIYYLVGKVHAKGGRTYIDTGTVVVPERAPGLLEGPTGTIIAALIIGTIAVLVYLYALRTERIMSVKGRAVATAFMVALVVGAGMYVFINAVPISGGSGGEDAPDFTVTSIEGKTFTLSDQRGKVVFLDLFATWCPSCNSGMPTLVKLQQRYKDAAFISISVEGSGDTDELLQEFKSRYGADWTFARDTDRVWQQYQDLGQPFIPTLVIINPQGKITFRDIGEVPFEELSEQMDKASKGGFDVSITTKETSLALVALVTGVLSFFSPCAFPLLPGYMSYCLARKEGIKARKGATGTLKGSVRGGIVAALGILAIFTLAGVLVAAAGSTIVAYVAYLTPVIAVIIAIMGFLMLVDRTSWADRLFGNVTTRVQNKLNALSGRKASRTGGNRGLFLYGAGYGIASMGCQAPVFVAIIVAGFAAGGVAEALMVFVLFGIGMGAMMVMVTVLVGMAKGIAIQKMTSAMPYIKRVSGLILLVAGIYLAWYYGSLLSA